MKSQLTIHCDHVLLREIQRAINYRADYIEVTANDLGGKKKPFYLQVAADLKLVADLFDKAYTAAEAQREKEA